MELGFTETANLKRGTRFPVNVSRLYSCPLKRFPYHEQGIIFDKYEITIRLDSESRLCQDIIDNEVMNVPFPNVVFKSPGMRISVVGEMPREAIGFSYPAEHIALLRQWNMLPEKKFFSFKLAPELQELFNQFRKFCLIYPSLSHPGDVIDGLCFNILRELRICSLTPELKSRTPEMRIREAELFIRHHFDESINFDEIASRFDFSHSGFYQHWKKHYNSSPHQYLEELKLRSAAVILMHSTNSVAEAVQEVRFSGVAAFYRKFKEYFGVTPNEFRKSPELACKYFPDLQVPGK